MKLSKLNQFVLILLFVSAMINLPVRSYLKAYSSKNSPQLILVLGGDIDREEAGAKLAKILKLPLVVSGGSNPEYANWSIRKIGLAKDQFLLDYRAKDTFTNFTSLVDEFSTQDVDHILLITSKDHMDRARNIGAVIAGSRGIKLTNISIPCNPNCKPESTEKKLKDIFRSIIWVLTGKDLKSIKFKQFI